MITTALVILAILIFLVVYTVRDARRFRKAAAAHRISKGRPGPPIYFHAACGTRLVGPLCPHCVTYPQPDRMFKVYRGASMLRDSEIDLIAKAYAEKLRN